MKISGVKKYQMALGAVPVHSHCAKTFLNEATLPVLSYNGLAYRKKIIHIKDGLDLPETKPRTDNTEERIYTHEMNIIYVPV